MFSQPVSSGKIVAGRRVSSHGVCLLALVFPGLCSSLLDRFTKSLNLHKIPDMTFADNTVEMRTTSGGGSLCLSFRALDALRRVDAKGERMIKAGFFFFERLDQNSTDKKVEWSQLFGIFAKNSIYFGNSTDLQQNLLHTKTKKAKKLWKNSPRMRKTTRFLTHS